MHMNNLICCLQLSLTYIIYLRVLVYQLRTKKDSNPKLGLIVLRADISLSQGCFVLKFKIVDSPLCFNRIEKNDRIKN